MIIFRNSAFVEYRLLHPVSEAHVDSTAGNVKKLIVNNGLLELVYSKSDDPRPVDFRNSKYRNEVAVCSSALLYTADDVRHHYDLYNHPVPRKGLHHKIPLQTLKQ